MWEEVWLMECVAIYRPLFGVVEGPADEQKCYDHDTGVPLLSSIQLRLSRGLIATKLLADAWASTETNRTPTTPLALALTPLEARIPPSARTAQTPDPSP